MKPKIILHVGCEKTGSTSIQYECSGSYNTLLDMGVLFPRTIGFPTHIHLTACALGGRPDHPIRNILGVKTESKFDRFVGITKENFAREIETTNPKTIVISDEHINAHLFSRDLLNNYKEICERFGEISKVIIYLRRQDEFRLSLFSEAIKSGVVSRFDVWNPLPTFESIPYRFNYFKILENLSAVFGSTKVHPVIFDRKKFRNHDVVSDFLERLDLPSMEHLNLYKHVENKSIDASIIMRLSVIFCAIEYFKIPCSLYIRSRIISFFQSRFSGRGVVLNDDVHDKFMLQFEEINNALMDKYFKSLCASKSLFPARPRNQLQASEYYPYCTLSWFSFLYRCVIKK